jgi:hypothetical protein
MATMPFGGGGRLGKKIHCLCKTGLNTTMATMPFGGGGR